MKKTKKKRDNLLTLLQQPKPLLGINYIPYRFINGTSVYLYFLSKQKT